MDAISARILASVVLALGVVAASASLGEEVVLRAPDGRFLRVTPQGELRADRILPSEEETFELTPAEGERVTLKSRQGRFLTVVRQSPGGESCVVLAAGAAMPAPPGPELAFEIYRAGQLPTAVQAALGLAISGLAAAELQNKEYDKVRSRLKEEYVELPAPTLRDLKRKKRHRVFVMREEYQVHARLDGLPDIRLMAVPYLKNRLTPGRSVLMFAVEATLPLTGRVRYKIPDRLSASTGFRTVVDLAVVGQVKIEKTDDQVSTSPPEVLDVRVALRQLDLSNDLLNAARKPIEQFINRELRGNDDRIREQANEIVRKAVESQTFRHPLLGFVSLP
jgi:hypothetical protein